MRVAADVYLNKLPSSYVALNLVSPTPMATPVMDRTQTPVMDRSQLIQYDECLRAILISHARVVYGPGYPAGSVFDVVNSPGVIDSTRTVSHVIVYPTAKLFPADAGKCVEVMRSTEHLYVQETYWSLMRILRPKILKAIDDQNQ
ncbi:hypothetical protein GT037_004925 [Alternaria burnsii]|uniref:Uncharacterized protein n=1 Tax=Alternaria burnsii TaxID=1187904 RepID=A0A8H7B7Q7_9PLEO|nr:uncharacterized protein GT037_004925 [Alternaria burnsii]KAF7676713.1 hypothetical protein GT037_004925 [Alternaria burnsii]